MTNILTLPVMIVTLFTTNVHPLKPSEGFPEREFLTNIVQSVRYEFTVSNRPVRFTFTQTNSSIVGVYLPTVKTNLVPKSSYPATPGQLGQPIEAHIEWHQNSTNANSVDSPR